MSKTIITGNESYYPAVWDSAHNGTIQSDGGITIRQKFIADYIKGIGAKYYHPSEPTNWLAVEKEADAAFQSFLKLINEPQS